MQLERLVDGKLVEVGRIDYANVHTQNGIIKGTAVLDVVLFADGDELRVGDSFHVNMAKGGRAPAYKWLAITQVGEFKATSPCVKVSVDSIDGSLTMTAKVRKVKEVLGELK